jgi:nucleotide-binding universal stress UspA family protein
MATRNGSFSPLNRPLRALRTVLIGTSLGEESDQVVRAGLAIARAAGARVVLAHATQPNLYPLAVEIGVGPDLEREQVALAVEELRRQVEWTGIGEAELAFTRVVAGAPHRVLVSIARETAADLIVVGATGTGPLAAELLGSTAERVLRKAPCPVLVVRGELRVPPRRVLVPVDLSTLSGDAFHCGLYLVAQLAAGGNVEAQVVYALGFVEAAVARARREGGTLEDAERVATEGLRRFVLENRPEASLGVRTAILGGEPRAEILRELREHPADLVLMGTHGRGGPDRLLLGSVAATVARKAPCSVLLISPEAALAAGIAEAVVNQTTPAWHDEPVPVV